MSYSKISQNPANDNGYIIEIKNKAAASALADAIDQAPAWEVTEVRISFPTNRAYIWVNKIKETETNWGLQKILNHFFFNYLK